MMISKGLEQDLVTLEIKNPYFFTSNVTGLPLEDVDIKIMSKFPKQLPKGVSQEALED